MKSALGFDASVGDPPGAPFALLGDRYSIVGKLRSTGRAEVSIGLPVGARSIDELLVIKAYGTRDSLVEAPPEVEVARAPRHANLARVLDCRWDVDRYVIASEYLEGTTLRRLLRWLSAQGQKLPDAAVARILLGMFAAVEHANHWTRGPRARALVQQPIDATDVFITNAGDVKLLGFKSEQAHDGAYGARPTSIEPAAVDALLSHQCSPALGAVLVRIGERVSAASLIGLWQVAQILKDWQSQELRSDGRDALAAVMASVNPEARAARRAQFEVAVARVVRARDEADAADHAAAVSGYRGAGSIDPLAVDVQPGPVPEPEVPATVLDVGASELIAQQWLEPLAATRAFALPFASRRRSMPWATLVVLAAVLAAALVVTRRSPGARIEPASSAVAPAASASAGEPAARPVPREGTRTKPAGAPARLPTTRPSAANGTPPR